MKYVTLTALLALLPAVQHSPVPDVRRHMAWAAEFSGYPAAALPAVYWAPGDVLDRLSCGTVARCRIDGAYQDGAIYLRAGYEGAELDATIVHEMTHYLQVQGGRHMHICGAEPEARRVEFAYQVIVEGQTLAPPTWIPEMYGC